MVLCSGAFDGLHAGHVRYLAAAKRLCDTQGEERPQQQEPLYVAVAPDRYIVDAKGRKPRWIQADRWRVVMQVQGVTQAYPSEHASIAEDIVKLKPRLFVKGVDWAGKIPDDVRAACREAGTQIVFVDTDGTHTRDAYQDAE